MKRREFEVETGLIVHNCHSCGISYAMPADFEARRRKDHKTFYCPSGHPAYFPHKNKEEELVQKLETAEACCQIYKNRAKHRDYQKRYYKGQVTKLKKTQGEG